MAADKQTKLLAKQLFKLSLVDGAVSPERVAGVLGWVEKTSPRRPVALLKAYHHLVAAEVARGQAVVEHAGFASASVLDGITAALTKKYGRRITWVAKPNDSLIAGLRVRVGDDTYESSVAGQLAALSASV